MAVRADSQLMDLIRLVIERHEGALVRYAWRLTGRIETARDVVQDTFLKLLAVETPPHERALAAWLFTVCRNRAFDIMRKERRMHQINDETMQIPADTPDPQTLAEIGETNARVLTALAGLPPNQQEVLRLKFQNGFSYGQISEITGYSVSNVGFLIHTGMKRLRKDFRKFGLLKNEVRHGR
jgi:RNA polymerase sigma-70 factor (ECF subfamily)